MWLECDWSLFLAPFLNIFVSGCFHRFLTGFNFQNGSRVFVGVCLFYLWGGVSLVNISLNLNFYFCSFFFSFDLSGCFYWFCILD